MRKHRSEAHQIVPVQLVVFHQLVQNRIDPTTQIARVVRPMLPFYLAMLVVLALVTYVPGLSLWLPALLD